MSPPGEPLAIRPPGPGWRRRLRRPPPEGRRGRLVRAARILVLLLGATGCAIDPPRPAGERVTAVVPPLVPPPIVSAFGEWRGEGIGPRPGRHAGIDVRAPHGAAVLTAADGVVRRVATRPIAGRMVIVRHTDDLATAYFHLSAVTVRPGERVRRGQPIGRVGTTGNATAPHLHFGVCRAADGLCGPSIEAGWEDPARHWVAGNPCFVPGAVQPDQRRLTYPIACAADGAAPAVLDVRPAPPRRPIASRG